MFCIIKKIGYLLLLALLSNVTFAQSSKEAAQKALGNSNSASEIISLIESGDPAEVFDAIVKLSAESKAKVFKYYELGKSENINPVRFKRGVRSIILGLYEEQRYPASEFLIDYNKFKKTGEIPSKSLPDAFRDLERATNIVPSSKGVFEASIEKFAKIKPQIEEVAIQKVNGYNEKLAAKEKNEAEKIIEKESNALISAVDAAKLKIAAAKERKDTAEVLRNYQEIVSLREKLLALASPDNHVVRNWNLLISKGNLYSYEVYMFEKRKDWDNWLIAQRNNLNVTSDILISKQSSDNAKFDLLFETIRLVAVLGVRDRKNEAHDYCNKAKIYAIDPMYMTICQDLANGANNKMFAKWRGGLNKSKDLSIEGVFWLGYLTVAIDIYKEITGNNPTNPDGWAEFNHQNRLKHGVDGRNVIKTVTPINSDNVAHQKMLLWAQYLVETGLTQSQLNFLRKLSEAMDVLEKR